jgi:hypothetical protein
MCRTCAVRGGRAAGGQAFEHLRRDGSAPFAGQLGQGALQRQQQVELDGARQQFIPVDAGGVLLQHEEKIIPPQQVAAFMVQPQVGAQVQGQGGGVQNPGVGGGLRQRLAVVEEPVHAPLDRLWGAISRAECSSTSVAVRMLERELDLEGGVVVDIGDAGVTVLGQQGGGGGQISGGSSRSISHHGAQGGFLVVGVEQTNAFEQSRLDAVGMQAKQDVLSSSSRSALRQAVVR